MPYRWLEAWAARDQRRFEEQQKRPPRSPGSEPLGARVLTGLFGTVATVVKLVTLPVLLVWTITLIAQHTVRSIVLAVAVSMILSISTFTGVATYQGRRRHGRNIITGLARKPR
jgi:hypothetical protein